jgi:hypothetical protein
VKLKVVHVGNWTPTTRAWLEEFQRAVDLDRENPPEKPKVEIPTSREKRRRQAAAEEGLGAAERLVGGRS